jgi:hypothetical protein
MALHMQIQRVLQAHPTLSEQQRTFIDCDNVPPITTFTEFLGCLETQRALKVREHYKQLSHHDLNEQRYLNIRIQNYKDEHTTRAIMIQIPELGIEVDDVDDFNSQCDQMLEELADELWADLENRAKFWNGDEHIEVFPADGAKRVEDLCNQMFEVGKKYFNELDINISLPFKDVDE